MTRHRLYKVAREADLHAGQYAYVGRRLKKRDFRKLWIMRINAGLATYSDGLKYSMFMNLLKKAKIELNRKMLSELTVEDPEAFKAVIATAQRATSAAS